MSVVGFRFKRVLRIGAQSILRHGLRSALTVLGIVCGVAAVIAMLAVGEGMRHEALEQIRRLGSQNIIIRSVKPPAQQGTSTETTRMITYGLTYNDAERISATIPGVDVVVPVRTLRRDASFLIHRLDIRLKATVPWYADVARIQVLPGGRFFNSVDIHDHANVCVIGYDVYSRLFRNHDPIGEHLKVGGDYYRVIGVVASSGRTSGAGALADANLDVYIPLTTGQDRYGNIDVFQQSGSSDIESVELHQINVRVKRLEDVEIVWGAIERLLERFHKQHDYEVTVPLELLRQMERTKRLLNIVLGSIAAISLLVGGIGIMNIMLASVTERTREIGIRRALGAKRRDIILQFLTETVLLSVCGGIFGAGLGVALPKIVTWWFKMPTIITFWSLALSLGVSVLIGIVFGIYPAQRAAAMDPIEALRHE